jgi:hypothetical protein
MSDTINLAATFNDPAYADLLVRFGPHFAMETVYLHKVLVCPQSSLFRATCAASPHGKQVILTIHPHYDHRAVKDVLLAL